MDLGDRLAHSAAGVFPSIRRDKQTFTTAKRQAMVDPHGAIAQCSAQRQQRGDFEGTKCLLAIGAAEQCPPHPAKINHRGGWKFPRALFIDLA